MLQLLMTLFFSAVIFWISWHWLGARELIKELLRDERRELQHQLNLAEDCLAEMAADPHPDETSEVLQLHYEKEARQLRRRLARINQDNRPQKEIP